MKRQDSYNGVVAGSSAFIVSYFLLEHGLGDSLAFAVGMFVGMVLFGPLIRALHRRRHKGSAA